MALNKNRGFYLNGIDWIVQGMQWNCQHAPGGDYQFLIVSKLTGTPDENRLRQCVASACSIFPVLFGSLKRNWLNLAPYWSSKRDGKAEDILTVTSCASNETETHLTEFLNTPFKERGAKIAAKLLKHPDGTSHFALNLDHRLFDASGGERFLTLLDSIWNGQSPSSDDYIASKGPWLDEWSHQFSCGKTVNRSMLRIKERGKPSVLHSDQVGINRFQVLNMDQEQFTMLSDSSLNLAGPMMLTPYLITAVQSALHRIFKHRGQDESRCLCPMTVNLRTGNKNELLFNHWSIMPMCSRSNDSFEERLMDQKTQFYTYMKERFPYSLTKSTLLCRPLPLWAIAKFSSHLFSGTAGTAAMAFLSQPEYSKDTFLDMPLKNLYHVPRVPPKPGIGVFMNRFGDSLNITLSWCEGVLTQTEQQILLDAVPASARSPH